MLSMDVIDINDMSHAARAANFQADPAIRLRTLSAWHDDLDLAIGALVESGHYDDLALSRLKKRKLQIRDEMAGVTAQGDGEPVPAPAGDATPADRVAVQPAMPQITAQRPGATSGLATLFAFAVGAWAILEVMTDSASEIYTGLLILALLGASGG